MVVLCVMSLDTITNPIQISGNTFLSLSSLAITQSILSSGRIMMKYVHGSTTARVPTRGLCVLHLTRIRALKKLHLNRSG